MTGINATQYAALMRPLNGTRVAKRSGGGGKQLSYLEAWEVRAHLIRVLGFGNFDAEVLSADLIFQMDKEIGSAKKPGWEVAYKVIFRLVIRDHEGTEIACYREAAVGSAEGAVGLGDLHDNAVKQAASDALKRCAINLGTQFGLSLYDNGATREIVKQTLVVPEGVVAAAGPSEAQVKMLQESLGATQVTATDDRTNESAENAETEEQSA